MISSKYKKTYFIVLLFVILTYIFRLHIEAKTYGFDSYSTYKEAKKNGFKTKKELDIAKSLGFNNKTDYQKSIELGFKNAEEFRKANSLGYPDAVTYSDANMKGYPGYEYYLKGETGGFPSFAEFIRAQEQGISNYADYTKIKLAASFRKYRIVKLNTYSPFDAFLELGRYPDDNNNLGTEEIAKKNKLLSTVSACRSGTDVALCFGGNHYSTCKSEFENALTGMLGTHLGIPRCSDRNPFVIKVGTIIANNTKNHVKDVTITCEQIANSEHVLNEQSKTFYTLIPPKNNYRFDFEIYRHEQAESLYCYVKSYG